jgi:hypothetical protein
VSGPPKSFVPAGPVIPLFVSSAGVTEDFLVFDVSKVFVDKTVLVDMSVPDKASSG